MEQDYEAMVAQSAEELFQVMETRIAPQGMERIRDAYDLAYKAHKGQKRKGGQPYIIHPIAVARIVGADLNLGANPVIAALLHDVVEDTPVELSDIEKRFGSDVAFLVKVVTKQKKQQYEMSKQLDNFKQMLDSVHYDIRAILIKLADRLNNMRTLDSMRPDKQMKIAGETDYFYAPLANRLGLYNIKTELENLSFQYRCPQEFNTIVEHLKADEREYSSRIKTFTDRISIILSQNDVSARILVKYRKPYSIWRKMMASGADFKHIDNRHYIHIVFPDNISISEKHMCLRIYSLLTDMFKEKPGSVDNLIDSPKENGYQGFHVKLLSEHGDWEEVHIGSERMLLKSQRGCVADRGMDNIKKWIEKFKVVLQDIAFHTQDSGFIENVVSSFYSDDIMVFTPKGRVVLLPKGSTALDFAFEIHSHLGEHAQFARINGKLMSVKTELHRGDCVEIGINDSIHPEPDWINHVLTYKAKRCLRNYISHIPEQPYCRCEVCHPLPGDEVVGFIGHDKKTEIHKRNCPRAISRASQDGDSIVSIDFVENPNIHYPVCVEIKAVDRHHLLSDIVDCISNRLMLSITSLETYTIDQIVNCRIRFSVHSNNELQQAIRYIDSIDNVEEVRRVLKPDNQQ